MTAEDFEHKIRERAHSIWEAEGCPSDRADAHWAMASAELSVPPKPRARRTAAASAAPAAKRVSAAPAAKRKAAATGTARRRKSPDADA